MRFAPAACLLEALINVSQQISRLHAKRDRKALQHPDRRIANSALEAADICPVEASGVRQDLPATTTCVTPIEGRAIGGGVPAGIAS